MNRYFVFLTYNGKAYCGWQRQPNGDSVQQTLETALGTILRHDTPVTGAGRTDTGVHARLMVAHFDSEEAITDIAFLADKLNVLLPKDIAVIRIEAVTPEAHARFSATSRTYQYQITDKKDPFRYGEVFRMHHLPDIDTMNDAAQELFHHIDFTSFSKLHTDTKTNNCHIMQAEWKREGDLCIFTIQADRFLRNMVRAIVGTLLDVGRGKLTKEGFRKIIESKNRCAAGTSVPAEGLFLCDISYPSELFIDKK
jgi:tRNA pseudouridine38-40 synthase